jgi:hypothetical protein
MGRLADHLGRGRVCWNGHVLLGGAYSVLLLPSTWTHGTSHLFWFAWCVLCGD